MTPSQELESAFEKKFGRGVVSLTISSQDNTRIWPDFEIRSFIAEREALAERRILERIRKEWGSIDFLNHHDEGNDDYWMRGKGDDLVMTMHVTDFDRFDALLTPQDTQVNSKEI